MNRIETRIIVMVTDRLSAARNSEAKNELIEELSENLYQRYQDLTAEGLTEEAALQQAMESLGDTDELIAYLRSVDTEGYDAGEGDAETAWEEPYENAGKKASYKKRTAFFGKNLENEIEDIVNVAVSAAKNAADYARDAARDMSEQFKERYPDGFTWQFNGQRSGKIETVSFPADGIHSLDVHLVNSDIEVYLLDDPNASIEVKGDAEYIKTVLQENGVLSVKQENTASTSALFNRGVVMMGSEVEIRLPKKIWDTVSLVTVSGDIWVDAGLQCQTAILQSQSGDLSLTETVSHMVKLRSNSGDIKGTALQEDVQAETNSGEVELSGSLEECTASSISGDVCFEGSCRSIDCTSTSGNVEIKLEQAPDQVKVASVSGDCSVYVPREMGFRLSYHTTSGEFDTNLSLTGAYRGKQGNLSYLDGGNSRIRISSVSGDLEISGR